MVIEVIKFMDNKITLNQSKFDAFMEILSIIKSSCKDLSIKKGILRQQSNNTRNIFEVKEIHKLIGYNDIVCNNIASKHFLLSVFQKQRDDIDINIHDKYYVFTNGRMDLNLPKPIDKYLLNKYMDDNSREKIVGLDNYTEVCTYDIDRSIIESLNTFARGLEAEELNVEFKDNSVVFVVSCDNKSIGTRAVPVKIDKSEINNIFKDLKGVASFPIEPLLLCPTPFELKLYKRLDGSSKVPVLMMKIKTEIEFDDNDTITFNLYGNSVFKNEESI